MTHRRRASATDNSAVIERLERERDEANDANEALGQLLRESEEEKRELMAHCERLRGALQRMVDEAAHLAGFSENTERAVVDALNETPQTFLREIRAEAFTDGYYEGVGDDWWYSDHDENGNLLPGALVLTPLREYLGEESCRPDQKR